MIELMGQGIAYASRTTIKSQVLADFVAEWTEVQMPPVVIDQEYWTMYFDGSLMKKGAGAGLVFVSPPQGTHEVHGPHPFPLL